MTEKDWMEVINTNLNSVFNVTRQVIDGMVERGWGRVINISSVNAVRGQFGQTNYASAKAGILGFTKSLAQEVVKKGVTVNAISPGYVQTEMVMAIREDVRQKIVSEIPAGRLAMPEEVADAVAFLASENAAYTCTPRAAAAYRSRSVSRSTRSAESRASTAAAITRTMAMVPIRAASS